MPFPEVRRFIYRRNPLSEVICQLRFPPILRIDADVPATFQEQIRAEYPEYTQTSDVGVAIPRGISEQISQEVVRQALQASATKNYQFATEDNDWRVNLTRTFVSLSTRQYERWELFRSRLERPLAALISIYSPNHFSRVGLRYIDVIRRSTLGLNDVPWRELLKPHIAAVLSTENVASNVQISESTHEIRLSDNNSIARIVAKLVSAKDDGEVSFMIDTDFFTRSRIECPGVWDRLDYLNARASRLIRWCITDRLHEAMEPTSI